MCMNRSHNIFNNFINTCLKWIQNVHEWITHFEQIRQHLLKIGINVHWKMEKNMENELFAERVSSATRERSGALARVLRKFFS